MSTSPRQRFWLACLATVVTLLVVAFVILPTLDWLADQSADDPPGVSQP